MENSNRNHEEEGEAEVALKGGQWIERLNKPAGVCISSNFIPRMHTREDIKNDNHANKGKKRPKWLGKITQSSGFHLPSQGIKCYTMGYNPKKSAQVPHIRTKPFPHFLQCEQWQSDPPVKPAVKLFIQNFSVWTFKQKPHTSQFFYGTKISQKI
jgi:hypothetical protein